MITLGGLNEINGVRHCFFSRNYGVSEGLYRSLNGGFGSKDDPAKVTRNRRLAAERLDLDPVKVTGVDQRHTAEVVAVADPWSRPDNPIADALVTDRPGIGLLVLTADCAPVFLADRKARAVAAIHAGWKGAFGGVIENTVAAMAAFGVQPADIVAGIGPTIAHRSYEVGPEFKERFVGHDALNEDLFVPARRAHHHFFDLPGYVSRRLQAAGVGVIVGAPHDTYAEEDRFFSHRRSVHRGEPDYGRNISIIARQT